MVSEHGEYTNLEIELRQSLLKGYSRVRRAEAHGQRLQPAECVLDLLGDPQVLRLGPQNEEWMLGVPLVYVAQVPVNADQPIGHIRMVRHVDERILTPYRRRFEENDTSHPHTHQIHQIHQIIVDSLQAYLPGADAQGALLLDVLWAPRARSADHNYITSENWTARFPSDPESPDEHWLFRDVRRDQLPSTLWPVNSLIRLTFPPSQELEDTIVTVVLGLSINIRPDPEDFAAGMSEWKRVERERARAREIMSLVRRLARIIINEVPQLFDSLQKRELVSQMMSPVPSWLETKERDALHASVDELHRELNRLAARVRLPEWNQPENGFKFLIAFKELDAEYKACLRYCLSVQNLNAFGVDSGVKTLQQEFESGLARYRAGFGGRDNDPCVRSHLSRCEESIRDLFFAATDVDVRRRLRDRIETTHYPLRLTPGYWVMTLGHPELIDRWLDDPRSGSDFLNQYPADLLVWENIALRGRIYYSPVSDGIVPVGVCGVDAAILERCSAYELQQMIDDSGARFRRILCRRELHELGEELKDRRAMVTGAPLWDTALLHFRRLAYYYLPDPLDFHTKLVSESELDAKLPRKWEPADSDNLWQYTTGLSDAECTTLAGVEHVPWQWRREADEPDFLKGYITNTTPKDYGAPRSKNRDFTSAQLHRVRLPHAEGYALLVLIPNPYHEQLAHDLLTSFLSVCTSALGEFDEVAPVVQTPDETATDAFFNGDRLVDFVAWNPHDRKVVWSIVAEMRHHHPVWLADDQGANQPWLPVLLDLVNRDRVRSMVVMLRKDGVGLHQERDLRDVAEKLSAKGRPVIAVLLPGAPSAESRWPAFLRESSHGTVRIETAESARAIGTAIQEQTAKLAELLLAQSRAENPDKAHVRPIRIFVSYSHKDNKYVRGDASLIDFLQPLKNEGVEFWSDQDLLPGDPWDSKIKERIDASHLALVLVSQRFLISDYCTNQEVDRFLSLKRQKGFRIVPIILAPCAWEDRAWLRDTHFMPTDGKTVSTHFAKSGARDVFYKHVYDKLKAVVEEVRSEGLALTP